MHKLLLIGLLLLSLGRPSKIEVTIGGADSDGPPERELFLDNPILKQGLSFMNKMKDQALSKLGLFFPNPETFKTVEGIKKVEAMFKKLGMDVRMLDKIKKDPLKAHKEIKKVIFKVTKKVQGEIGKLIKGGMGGMNAMLHKFGIKPAEFQVPWWNPFKPLKDKRVTRCLLSMEVFPLYYTTINRQSTFRLAFSSNCLTKRDINFEIYYNNTPYINFNYHPTRVILKLWGNVYKINYRQPKIIDRFDVMRSLEYQKANIRNLVNPIDNLHTTYLNNIVLDPQSKNTFNTFNIRKLAQTKGRVQCTTVIRRPTSFSIQKIMDREKKNYYKRRKRKLKEVAAEKEYESGRDKFADANDDVFGKQAQKKGIAPRELKQVKKKGKKGKKKRKKGKKGKKKRKKLKVRSLKRDMKELSQGKQGMLLLLSKNSIKEILIECAIN